MPTPGPPAGDDGAADVAFSMWKVLQAVADGQDPIIQFAVDLKREIGEGGTTSDAQLHSHLETRMEGISKQEKELQQQIEVKEHARDRLQAELRKYEATLKQLTEEKAKLRIQRRFTEACLKDVSQRESRIRIDVINATRKREPSPQGQRPQPVPSADAAVTSQKRSDRGAGGERVEVPVKVAEPQGQSSQGQASEVQRIDAVLWHLGQKSDLKDGLRQSLIDFERHCAAATETPWDASAYPAWVRCTQGLLQRAQGAHTPPALQALLLRCLTEVVKRWINVPRQQPSIPELLAQNRMLELLVKLLQSVNDEVKAEAALLVTALATVQDSTMKEAFGTAGGVHAVMNILTRSNNDYVLEKALVCAWHLAMSDANKTVIREAGGLAAIVNLLHHDSEVMLENVTIALGYLTRDDSNKVAIRKCNGLEKLVATLYYPSESIQSKAAGALWNCASNLENKVVIRQMGAIAALIDLLYSRSDSVQENAAGGLWNCAVDTENKRLVRELGGLQPLIALLASPVDSVVENASGTLWNCAAVGDNRVAIRKLGGLEPLLRLLKHKNENIQENAAGAVRNCAINDQNKVVLRELGGMKLFVSLLETSRYTVLEKLTSTLWICSINPENKNVIRECGGFPKLFRMLDHDHPSIREKALGILRNCSTVQENRQELLSAGIVQRLVRFLAGDKLSDGMKEYSAATLWNLARDDKQVVPREGALAALVQLLGDKAETVVENAAGALLSLTMYAPNRDLVREHNGIPVLIKCLQSWQADFLLENVTSTLKNLTQGHELNQRLVYEAGVIPLVLPLLKLSAENVVREAALLLKNLASIDEISEAIGRAGVVSELLRLAGDSSQAEGVRKVTGFTLAALSRHPLNRRNIPPEYRPPASSR